MKELEIIIPGDPHPQGRGRVVKRGKFSGIKDPDASFNWKAYATGLYLEALREEGLEPPLAGPGEPVRMSVVALFTMPTSRHLKSSIREEYPHIGTRADIDNILKAVLDAGNGVLWLDDGQVWNVNMHKVVGAQGEPGRVVVHVAVEGPR